ncbi:retrovirus-related Pol polyprotein from transposon 412 [Trichonephila clavipes]|nr:retrovirus-related Pol polyprotein from transposon 412 [Trichonephila clavipes]
MADPDIKPLIEFMESSSNKPSWQDISAYSPTTKQYWALWNSLHLRNGVLYRKIRIRGWKDIQVAISTSSISYPRGTQRIAWQPNRRSFRRHENFAPSSRAILLG